MIHRTAVITAIVLVLLMLAATLWRIDLLPDWAYGLNGAPPPIRRLAVMFVAPACVAFLGGLLALKKWLTTAPADAVEPWKRWGSQWLVAYAATCTLIHLYLIARSAGFAAPSSPTIVARAIIVLYASLFMVVANRMPKLPWVPSRLRIWHLDPIYGARLLRSGARLLVVWGLAIAIGAVVLPPQMLLPLVASCTIAVVLGAAVIRFALHREQGHQRLGSGG